MVGFDEAVEIQEQLSVNITDIVGFVLSIVLNRGENDPLSLVSA
jgi:hypothetical protein